MKCQEHYKVPYRSKALWSASSVTWYNPSQPDYGLRGCLAADSKVNGEPRGDADDTDYEEEKNMVDLKQVDEALNSYVRPLSFPIAVRMCESQKGKVLF